ncbi:MAG: sulfatase [Gemmatimonadota bacterium]
MLALWFGFGGGAAEVTVRLLRRFVRHRFMFLSDDVIWMGPVMVTILLLVAGSLLWMFQRRRARPLDDLLLPLFLAIATLGVLISYPRLHWSADAILALGIAYQGTRMIRRRRLAFERLVYRTVPILIGLVLLSTAGLYATRWWVSRRDRSSPAPDAPNVLLIILDTVRGLDFKGGSLVDAYLPRLARRAEQGVRFDLAFSASSWTLPSHASLFTGRWPAEHRANWSSPLDNRFPTLAEVLANHGYATAGFVANTSYASRETGLGRGFQHYRDYEFGPGEFFRSSAILQMIGQDLGLRRIIGWHQILGRKNADRINRQALDWLGHNQHRPFFVFLNYLDAHAPYLPPAPFDSALRALPGASGRDQERRFRSTWQRKLPPGPIMLENRVAYAASLAYLDDRVNRLLDSLDTRGLLANTLVILGADHGEEFGEHDAMGHGHNVFRTTVQVPLMIWRPGETPGRVTMPVTLRDIPATVMSVTGLGSSSPFPGRSLLDPMPDSVRSELVWVPGLPPDYGVGDGDQVSWIVDSIRVIARIGGTKAAFPVYSDPFEGGREAPIR